MAYLEWAQWSPCNIECGGGTKKRSRTCLLEEKYCDKKTEVQDCNTHICPSRLMYLN